MAVPRSRPEAAPLDLQDVDARLARLERELATLAERVTRLDQLAAGGNLVDPGFLALHAESRQTTRPDRSARIITHIGQMLIALGVGYLLRALTEVELVDKATGVWIGLAYAFVWIGLSIFVARRGDRLAAWFAAALTPALAFPLVIEAALRFALWTPSTAFLVLAGVTTASLANAIRNGHQSLAWITSLGAGGTAAALMVGMRAYVPAEIFYIALGIVTLWLGYLWHWTLLRWPAALAADLVAVALVLRALTPAANESPHAVMGVLLLLLAAYPLSIMVRTIVLNRSVVVFEVVQSLALLLLLRGALALAPLIGSARPLLGFSVLGLGAATFATAVFFGASRRAAALNAHFYAGLGTVTLMVGSAILLDEGQLAIVWAGMALAVAAIACRPGRATFMAYAAALGIAAAVPSGLMAYATHALVNADAASVASPSALLVGVFVVVGVLLLAAVWPKDPASAPLRRAAAVVTGVVVLWSGAGLVAGAVIPVIGSASTVRTVMLSLAACTAAAAGRWPPLAALAWTAYPFLAFVAVKLLAEDLRVERPMALFIALAVYGAALITTARLGRQSSG